MKLCKDCKWYETTFGACVSPKNMTKIDLVTGKKSHRLFCLAQNQRIPPLNGWLGCRITNTCGAEGRWFEPK